MEQTQQTPPATSKHKILNRWFYIVFFILILISIGVTFYKVVILKDYQIIAETSCDPQTDTQACFAREEQVATTTPEGILSTTTEISYYKQISKQAMSISQCEESAEKNGCTEELSCTEAEKNCSYTYCDEKSVPEGEKCFSATTE